jgi:uncharacterized protein YbbC (DUF1343 family)
MNTEIAIGLETCVAQRPTILESARFGLLSNRASVDRRLRLAWDVLDAAYPHQIAALFSPQHGFWGDAQANMIETDHQWHTKLNLPIYSLYAASRRPTAAMLAPLDCLVIDLQDVGARVYTYVWTMLECLRACAEANVGVLVLDRPNPLGGRIVEGPLLEDRYRSFVGGLSIPMRHGLTIGELAMLLKSEWQIDVLLDVVPIRDWCVGQTFATLGRVWVPPSPNLPTVDSTLVYPGQVLLEGTNLSEGRGTTMPFQLAGAPYIDSDELLAGLAVFDLPGVRFLPIQFRPSFDKWQGELCRGVSIHVTDTERFRPVKTSIAILHVVSQRWPSDFKWLDPPYEYETEKPPIDIIFGSPLLRECIGSPDAINNLSQVDVSAWSRRTAGIQLYSAGNDRFDGSHETVRSENG